MQDRLDIGRSMKEHDRIYDYALFFEAEDGIRELVRSRGLGDVYKRQVRRAWVRRCFHARLRSTPVSQVRPSAGPAEAPLLSLIYI